MSDEEETSAAVRLMEMFFSGEKVDIDDKASISPIYKTQQFQSILIEEDKVSILRSSTMMKKERMMKNSLYNLIPVTENREHNFLYSRKKTIKFRLIQEPADINPMKSGEAYESLKLKHFEKLFGQSTYKSGKDDTLMKKCDPAVSEKAEEKNTGKEKTYDMKNIPAKKQEQITTLLKTVEPDIPIKEGKPLTGFKSAVEKAKKTVKTEERWTREGLQTEKQPRENFPMRTTPGRELLKLKVKSTMLCYALIIGCMSQAVFASFSCEEIQFGELGERGTIVCNFPDNYHAVYWYDYIRPGSSPLTSYTHQKEDKTELCLENQNFDVSANGSLIICKVTVSHQKTYTAFVYTDLDNYEELTVSYKVIASPRNRGIIVQCDDCYGGRYYHTDTTSTLNCFFEGARPAVQIEWVEVYPQEDSLMTVTQEVHFTNNTDGTYNTSADLHLVAKSNRQIAVFVCRATYLSSEWKRESEILLDFSKPESFSSVPSKPAYFEINKRTEIRCGESDSIIKIWKLISSSGQLETIGFTFGNSTQMTTDITGIGISPEGNLIFESPQIKHEGEYVCFYSDGVNDKIQKTAVVVMIPPSPPFIQINGCNDAEYTCELKEKTIQNLSCSVKGIYPNATLEWISKAPSDISFHNYTYVHVKVGQAWDISVSVYFKVSQDVLCAKEIFVGCRLQGPTSRIINAERTAQLTPEHCISESEVNDHRKTTWIFTIIVVPSFVIMVVLLYRRCPKLFLRNLPTFVKDRDK